MVNYIWTNHAKERLKNRKIDQQLVIQAIMNPDRTKAGDRGSTEFQKRFQNKTVAAIVKENERGEKIILSCWMDPPNPGTKDFRRKQRYYQIQSASFLKKLWLTFLNQIDV